MNQQFRDNSEDEFDDLEKQLSAISLTAASDEYSQAMDQVRQKANTKSRTFWLPRAAAAFAFFLVFALTLLPFSQISVDNQTVPEVAQELVPEIDPVENLIATTPSYIEGIHYGRLINPVDVSENQTNDVVAFFWYPCDPCNRFEPFLAEWEDELSTEVSLTRVPAIWSEEMRFHARAYYTAQALGISEQTHDEFYAAFHRENENISSEEELIAFFARFNVTPAEVFTAYNGTSTLENLARAEQLNLDYQIRATPSLFIGGQFGVLPSPVADFGEWIEVTDYLLEAFCDPDQPTANTVQAC